MPSTTSPKTQYPQPSAFLAVWFRKVLSETLIGDAKHYTASQEILKSVEQEIQFDNDRETVAVMARIRYRNGNVCKLDWNPEHWETFVDMLVNKLKVNVNCSLI